MLILPIKRKWFDMILSGEKLEEYREIKPYYTSRILKLMCLPKSLEKDIINLLSSHETIKEYDILFRNGYSLKSPCFIAGCTMRVGFGLEKWGAEKGNLYYIFRIHCITPVAGGKGNI